MLYVYYGDVLDARKKVRVTIDNLLSKNSDVFFLRITDENCAEYSFAELTESQALFKNKYVVLLDNLLAATEMRDVLLDFLQEVAESENIFFILEEKIDTKTLKKLEKHAAKITDVAGSSAAGKAVEKRLNTFALADALGEGNRQKLWTLYCEAKLAGISDEEVQGVLFWSAKTMYLARKSGSATFAGLKPFVFNKAKRFASKKTVKQLQSNLNCILQMPHEARRKGVPLPIMLEQFILRGRWC